MFSLFYHSPALKREKKPEPDKIQGQLLRKLKFKWKILDIILRAQDLKRRQGLKEDKLSELVVGFTCVTVYYQRVY